MSNNRCPYHLKITLCPTLDFLSCQDQHLSHNRFSLTMSQDQRHLCRNRFRFIMSQDQRHLSRNRFPLIMSQDQRCGYVGSFLQTCVQLTYSKAVSTLLFLCSYLILPDLSQWLQIYDSVLFLKLNSMYLIRRSCFVHSDNRYVYYIYKF